MDESFARELEAVHWFAACGHPLAGDLPFVCATVGSIDETIERCSDQSWEDATLEAQNRLTLFLHTHHRAAYQRWNDVVDAAKQRIVTPLAERVWGPFGDERGFGKVFVDCVSWDVLGAVMEHEYRRFAGRPTFALQLLRVYQAGHFPCGWSGAWPAGHLWVW